MLPCNMTRTFAQLSPNSTSTRVRNPFHSNTFHTLKIEPPTTPTIQNHLFTLHKNTGGIPLNRPQSLTPQTAADSINLHPSQTLFPEIRPCAPCSRTMSLAYFDCFSGISGDMTLGALLDPGCVLARLRSDLQSLQVPGWELTAEKVWKNGMAAPYARVTHEDQKKHRSTT